MVCFQGSYCIGYAGKKKQKRISKLVYFWRGFSSKKPAVRIDRWIYNTDISLPSSSETSHKRARPSTTAELRSSIHMTIMFLYDNVSFLSRVCHRPDRVWLFSRTLHRGRQVGTLHKSRNTRNGNFIGSCKALPVSASLESHESEKYWITPDYLADDLMQLPKQLSVPLSDRQTKPLHIVTRIPEPRPWQRPDNLIW